MRLIVIPLLIGAAAIPGCGRGPLSTTSETHHLDPVPRTEESADTSAPLPHRSDPARIDSDLDPPIAQTPDDPFEIPSGTEPADVATRVAISVHLDGLLPVIDDLTNTYRNSITLRPMLVETDENHLAPNIALVATTAAVHDPNVYLVAFDHYPPDGSIQRHITAVTLTRSNNRWFVSDIEIIG